MHSMSMGYLLPCISSHRTDQQFPAGSCVFWIDSDVIEQSVHPRLPICSAVHSTSIPVLVIISYYKIHLAALWIFIVNCTNSRLELYTRTFYIIQKLDSPRFQNTTTILSTSQSMRILELPIYESRFHNTTTILSTVPKWGWQREKLINK